jgi:hypothetical protein
MPHFIKWVNAGWKVSKKKNISQVVAISNELADVFNVWTHTYKYMHEYMYVSICVIMWRINVSNMS